MNPMEILKGMLGKTSPQQMCMNFLKQNSNPIFKNLISMAEKGDVKGVEKVARNMYKEKGKDFDKEFGEFMTNFK